MRTIISVILFSVLGAAPVFAENLIYYKGYMGCDFYFKNNQIAESYISTVKLDEHLSKIDSDEYRLKPVCEAAPSSTVIIERHPKLPNTDYYRGSYSIDSKEGGINSLTEYYVADGCPVELELWSDGKYSYSNISYQKSCFRAASNDSGVRACKLALISAGEDSGYASAICDKTPKSAAHWACVSGQLKLGHNVASGQGFCRKTP